MAKKEKECSKCGCDRVFLIQAKLYRGTDRLTASLKWLCVRCLLNVMNLTVPGKSNEYDYFKAMRCMSDPLPL